MMYKLGPMLNNLLREAYGGIKHSFLGLHFALGSFPFCMQGKPWSIECSPITRFRHCSYHESVTISKAEPTNFLCIFH